MLENINKSKLSFDKYVELKGKTVSKSYSEKYKWVDKFMYAFSWFGNGVSIFLAFFFLQSLFYASFSIGSSNMWLATLGIIFFLTMFELLKRYVFSMFSLEFMKMQFSIFRRSMIGFIISTSLLLVGSIYFSLNGAQKFVDNQNLFETETTQITKINVDSLTNYYNESLITPLMDNNKQLTTQNNGYYETSTKMYSSKYTKLIEDNNTKIDANNAKISAYELERNDKIQTIRQTNDLILADNLEANKDNIIAFILISLMIELVIMFGIYYDKYYDYRTVKEYEETIINTPEFKSWHKYNFLLDIIYNSVKDVGDKLPSSNDLIEMARISKSPITPSEFERFIRILYNLEVLSKDGNKRILNIPIDNAKMLLKDYYNIK